MKTFAIVLFLSITLVVATSPATAAWGDFDTTFGFLGAAIDGAVTNHTPYGVALQADGKILVTGYRLVGGKKRFFLRRYLSDGQLDTSFGNNGSATPGGFLATEADYYGQRIAVQSNGRIAVVGIGNSRPTIWRFLSSGSADTSIGNGGMKQLSAYSSFPPQVATYSNILYVGVVEEDQSGTVILKFNSSGSQDMSFGSGGEAITDTSSIFSIQVDASSGNILVGGRRRSDNTDYGLERFLTTGLLDPTFNHWNATYGGDPQGQSKDFVRLSNGQFALNEKWHNLGQGLILFGANLVRLNSSGSFTSRSLYQATEAYSFSENPIGNCPDLTGLQSDGRVIMTPSNFKKQYRFSTNFSTVQSMTCSNYGQLASRTPAVLQTDDKMIAAGVYSGYITLVRTLP